MESIYEIQKVELPVTKNIYIKVMKINKEGYSANIYSDRRCEKLLQYAAGFSLCKESTFISIVGISSFLVNKLIKDIENGKVH